MKTFAFLAFAFVMLSVYSFPDKPKEELLSDAKALNFLVYRDCVMNYAFANSPSGTVEDRNVEFPAGFVNRGWKAQVHNGILYIYGKATQREINRAKKQTMYSHSVGQKRNGLFYPHYTNPPAVLPHFINEGELVSILEMTE